MSQSWVWGGLIACSPVLSTVSSGDDDVFSKWPPTKRVGMSLAVVFMIFPNWKHPDILHWVNGSTNRGPFTPWSTAQWQKKEPSQGCTTTWMALRGSMWSWKKSLSQKFASVGAHLYDLIEVRKLQRWRCVCGCRGLETEWALVGRRQVGGSMNHPCLGAFCYLSHGGGYIASAREETE